MVDQTTELLDWFRNQVEEADAEVLREMLCIFAEKLIEPDARSLFNPGFNEKRPERTVTRVSPSTQRRPPAASPQRLPSPAQEFWDEKWREYRPVTIETSRFRDEAEPSERGFLDLVGEVEGKKILELGCGTGLFTIYFAKMGAAVTAIDNSSEAVHTTAVLAAHNDVGGQVDAIELDANDLPSLGSRFDLVVGRFILHHIEPFERFAPTLSELLSEDGRGVFLENNARNPVLMFVRRFLIGRFGLPKYGDENEKPFDIGEIDCLHNRFSRVELAYPEMMCFQLAASYVFRSNRFAFSVLKGLDSWIYRHLPALNRYSYRQLIEVRR